MSEEKLNTKSKVKQEVKKENTIKISHGIIEKRIAQDKYAIQNHLIDERWSQGLLLSGKGNRAQIEQSLGENQTVLQSIRDHIKFLEKLLEE